MDKLTRINALFLVLRAFQAQLTTEGTFFAADGETEPTHHQSAVDYGRIIVADDSVHICSMLESCPSLMRKDSTGNSNEISTWKKLQGTVPRLPDCTSHFKWSQKGSGVYQIWPITNSDKKLSVFCEMDRDAGGWIVIQRRISNCLYFNRDWKSYKEGFGNLKGNFWIGLEQLEILAAPGKGAMLRVEMEEADKCTTASYGKFEISNAADVYRLRVANHSGNSSDGMGPQNGMRFSTPDRDHDNSSLSCATMFSGGWWFKDCLPTPHANLNGVFMSHGHDPPSGIIWGFNNGVPRRPKRVVMKIRYD